MTQPGPWVIPERPVARAGSPHSYFKSQRGRSSSPGQSNGASPRYGRDRYDSLLAPHSYFKSRRDRSTSPWQPYDASSMHEKNGGPSQGRLSRSPPVRLLLLFSFFLICINSASRSAIPTAHPRINLSWTCATAPNRLHPRPTTPRCTHLRSLRPSNIFRNTSATPTPPPSVPTPPLTCTMAPTSHPGSLLHLLWARTTALNRRCPTLHLFRICT